jgi:chloramphenicol-sensitive protein RarD
MWGLLPIFFKLLHHVAPIEVVAQRVLWSLVLMVILMAARRDMALRGIFRQPRPLVALTASAMLIACNWLTYVWAVNNGHVIAASLGYFLNPLVNVALGVLVLGERLRLGQKVAIGLAAAGVVIMAAAALTTLWISVVLALSFAFYGLIRKLTPVSASVGLGAETLILAPLAGAALFWVSANGGVSWGTDGVTTGLLIASGAVTTVPLLLFAVAAQRLSMSTLGLAQYLAPSLQFLAGVLLYGEKLTHGQMLSFGLIWLGLVLFASDSVATARRNRIATA